MFGVFCARVPQTQAGWGEQLLKELLYSEGVTAAAPEHILVSGAPVYQQEEGKMSQSLGSAHHLIPWGRGSRTNLRGRMPVNPISAYSLGCQTGDKWVRSPLELLGNGFVLQRTGNVQMDLPKATPAFPF